MASPPQDNVNALEKITTGDLTSGGLLKPEEFQQFFRDVQEQSDVLNRARAVPVDAPSGDIPRFDVQPRTMRAVAEGGSTPEVVPEQPSVPYQTQKTSLPWSLTWESVNESIGDYEALVRRTFTRRFASDLEILSSVGDEASANAFESTNDGWYVLAQARGVPAHDHMNGGTTAHPVNTELFDSMRGLMPEKVKTDRNDVVFFLSNAQKEAYETSLTDRTTAAGDAMLLSMDEPTPFGYQIMTPLGWPNDVAMMASMRELAYVIQNNIRLKSTTQSKENVMNDYAVFANLLSKTDFVILDDEAVVTATNIAAP
jgi:hypothetical protein